MKAPFSVSQLDDLESRFNSGSLSEDDIRLLISTCRTFLASGANCEPIEQILPEKAEHNSEKLPLVTGNGPFQIFCDGACQGNPGPGGWGAIIISRKSKKELKGGERYTTNNIMEMTAAIRALERLEPDSLVTVTTDSQYLKNGITAWIHGWKKNGWRTADKKPVKNKELWLRLDELNQRHKITWKWVKGHAGHPENERCDELARLAIAGQ